MGKEVFMTEDEDILNYKNLQEKSTTHLDDFRWPEKKSELTKEEDALYRNSSRCKRQKPIHLCDFETLEKRPNIAIPFTLYKAIVPIIEQLPYAVKVNDCVIKDDSEGRRGINTGRTTFDRPRIYKCPEVSIDDIEDPDMRNMIIKYMYTSEYSTATEEGASNFQGTKKVLDFSKKTRNKWIGHQKYEYPLPSLKPESWDKACGKKWDEKQSRFIGKPTNKFWSEKEIRNQDYILNMKTNELDLGEKVTDLFRRDRLRLPHMKYNSHYGGYKPQNTRHIPLEKTPYKITNFWSITSQQYGSYYQGSN